MKRLRNTLIIVNSVSLIGLILFLVFSKLSMEAGIRCTMVEALHMYCPGCGGTRALYSLLHFDIISALRYNIAVPFAVFVYAFYDIRAIIALVRHDENYAKREKFILIYVFIGILILNFIVRNILLWGFGIDFIGDVLVQ